MKTKINMAHLGRKYFRQQEICSSNQVGMLLQHEVLAGCILLILVADKFQGKINIVVGEAYLNDTI
jgi:hypothetical protein